MAALKHFHPELFKEYFLKNPTIQYLANMCYEAGMSAAGSDGIGFGLLTDQKNDIIASIDNILVAVSGSEYVPGKQPIPRYGRSKQYQVKCNFKQEYEFYVETRRDNPDDEGEEVIINEAVSHVCTVFLRNAVDLATSDSAGVSGTILTNDAEDLRNNLNQLKTFLDTVTDPTQVRKTPADPSAGKSSGS